MLKFILILWQLPQVLVSLFLPRFYKPEKSLTYKGKKVIVSTAIQSGVSLGNLIYVRRYPYNKVTWDAIRHEYGHCRQSMMLGWLYLIVIGLPSAIGCLIDRKCHGDWPDLDRTIWYYGLPWEKWADNLGGVCRFERFRNINSAINGQ